VHEIGHLLGLTHNPSPGSIMFYLELDKPASLEPADLDALAVRHRLRTEVIAHRNVGDIQVVAPTDLKAGLAPVQPPPASRSREFRRFSR